MDYLVSAKGTTIIRWEGATEFWWRSFGHKITVLPRTTFFVSNGNNIVSYNFARFAANDDVRDQRVGTGNGATCPRQQHDLNVETWLPNFLSVLLDW